MNHASAPADTTSWQGPGHREFIALMALLMAANAMATDMMLPALTAIDQALDIHPDNQRQLVITFFLFGFGGAQIVYGPLSDRFGRKPILLTSLAFYVACAALCAVAGSFTLLLAARVLHGVAAAGSRILLTSIIRDRFQGVAMAKLMSFVSIIFLLVPVFAPTIGQGLLVLAGWRAIFMVLAIYGFVAFLWVALRLPETLAEEHRRPLSLAKIREAFALTLRNRVSIGNALVMAFVLGALFGFINSVQQIVFDTFHRSELIGAVFVMIGGAMAASSFLNTRIVEALGTRRVLLIGLGAFVLLGGIHFAVAYAGFETLASFTILQTLSLACFGLISGNAGARAMQPMGHIAGTASSVQGAIVSIGGATLGLAIGQAFDGSTVPLTAGFFLCAMISLTLALWANRPEPPSAVA